MYHINVYNLFLSCNFSRVINVKYFLLFTTLFKCYNKVSKYTGVFKHTKLEQNKVLNIIFSIISRSTFQNTTKIKIKTYRKYPLVLRFGVATNGNSHCNLFQ